MSYEDLLSQPHSVVRASAGTGKTWLLTGRILRLLLAGVAPGRILAITFTQKAATEIESRVLARLRNFVQADEAQLQRELALIGVRDVATQERARHLYEEVLTAEHPLRATTFHAFCQNLLRRFPFEAGVVPGFDLLEETGELESEAWNLLEHEARANASLRGDLEFLLVTCDGLTNLRLALNDFLYRRSDWWAYTEGAEEKVAFAQANVRETLVLSQEKPNPLSLPVVGPMLARYCRYLERHPIDTLRRQLEDLTAACQQEFTDAERQRLISRVFLRADGEPRVPSKKLREILGGEASAYDQLREALTEAVLAAQDVGRKRMTLEASSAWYRCGERLLEHYQRLKHERNLLDFTDLEWKAYELLNRSQHAEWVQYKLDQRIDHLLIDEFQDTNPTQWRLLLPLLEEMAAGNEDRSRSVFLVGDQKQSIYRFRRAQPALFTTAQRWLEERLQAGIGSQARSYRSSPAITAFVNLVFASPSMESASLPGFETHETHRDELWGRAELLPLIPDSPADAGAQQSGGALRNPLLAPRVLPIDRRYEREGERLTQRIRALVGHYTIGSGANARSLEYGDILVLVRERTQVPHFERALRHAGIPYVSNGRTRLDECLEVQDLLHLMQFFQFPGDNLALASVLKSPLFCASDSDLVALAQTSASTGANWWSVLSQSRDQSNDSALGRAQQLLSAWLGRADRIPTHDLLDGIYNEGDVVARYVAASPPHLHARITANLTALLTLALDADSGRFPSLARFVSHLKTHPHLSASGATGEHCVRILTVHAAKGLEAPVVFLLDAARPPKQDRGTRALIEWPADAPRPTCFHLVGKKEDHDSVSRAIIAEQGRAAAQEELNLLYVALTRAQQLLFVSGCAPRQERDRFWYGRIEARLRAAEPMAGLEVHASREGGMDNVYGRLCYREPELTPKKSEAPRETRVMIDPALTRPVERTTNDDVVNPSESVRADASHGGRERGVAIHRMLEWLSTGEDAARVRARVEAHFRRRLSSKQLEQCWREACVVIDEERFRHLFDPSQFERAINELPLLYQDNGRQVHGVVDRLVFRTEELILVDYKTNEGVARETLHESAAHYHEQLRLYARGLKQLWPTRRVRALLLFTALPEAIEIAL